MKMKTIGYVILYKSTEDFISTICEDGYLATRDQTIVIFPTRRIAQKAIKKDMKVTTVDLTKDDYEIRRAVSYVD